MATSCTTVSVAADPMSPKRVAWRQISTSIVELRTPPRMRTTPNDVNVNTKTMAAAAPIAGRIAGSVISRNTRQRRRAERRRRRLAVAGQRRQHGADGAHDDRQVEQHVGGDDRHDAALDRGRQDGQHGGADHHGRQHEHGDEGAVEETPAGEVEAGDDVGGGEPDHDGQCRRDQRLPQREPHDVPRHGVAERLGERRSAQPAAEHACQRPGVEHGERRPHGTAASAGTNHRGRRFTAAPREVTTERGRSESVCRDFPTRRGISAGPCPSRSRSSPRGWRRSSPGRACRGPRRRRQSR